MPEASLTGLLTIYRRHFRAAALPNVLIRLSSYIPFHLPIYDTCGITRWTIASISRSAASIASRICDPRPLELWRIASSLKSCSPARESSAEPSRRHTSKQPHHKFVSSRITSDVSVTCLTRSSFPETRSIIEYSRKHTFISRPNTTGSLSDPQRRATEGRSNRCHQDPRAIQTTIRYERSAEGWELLPSE